MSKPVSKTAVGAFVLCALTLFVLSILWLGSSRLFSNDMEYVLYFDGSVSGLSTGAPVVFRGVPMGSVTRINLVANARDSNVTIPVYIRIDERSFVLAKNASAPGEGFHEEIIRRMVQRGMRARLQLQSLITGQYRIELDFYPGSPANFRSSTPEDEIPTIPSPMDTLQSTIQRLPLERMAASLNTVLQNLANALEQNRLERGLTAFADTFEEMRDLLRTSPMRLHAEQIMQNMDTASGAVERELPTTLLAFRQAMENMAVAAQQLRAATASAQGVLGRDSPAMADLRRMLKEGSDAARALRTLADMLERNPEALLKGRQGRH